MDRSNPQGLADRWEQDSLESENEQTDAQLYEVPEIEQAQWAGEAQRQTNADNWTDARDMAGHSVPRETQPACGAQGSTGPRI